MFLDSNGGQMIRHSDKLCRAPDVTLHWILIPSAGTPTIGSESSTQAEAANPRSVMLTVLGTVFIANGIG